MRPHSYHDGGAGVETWRSQCDTDTACWGQWEESNIQCGNEYGYATVQWQIMRDSCKLLKYDPLERIQEVRKLPFCLIDCSHQEMRSHLIQSVDTSFPSAVPAEWWFSYNTPFWNQTSREKWWLTADIKWYKCLKPFSCCYAFYSLMSPSWVLGGLCSIWSDVQNLNWFRGYDLSCEHSPSNYQDLFWRATEPSRVFRAQFSYWDTYLINMYIMRTSYKLKWLLFYWSINRTFPYIRQLLKEHAHYWQTKVVTAFRVGQYVSLCIGTVI